MELLTKLNLADLNTAPMFLIAGGVIFFIMLLCVVYLVKSYRAGIAMGMDKVKLRRAITSSATFTILPSVSILLGVVALSGSLGIPLPWLRLSVIGSLNYEGNVADIAARAAGQPNGLGTGTLTPSAFVTIGLVMTAGILIGALLCIFLLKKYLAKVQKPKEASQNGKKPFGDVVFSAMFIGLVSAYIGSYVGAGTSAGNWMPLFVTVVAGAAMALFEYFARVKKIAWLDNFSMACSMLIGMGAGVLAGVLF
ncbi:MAG: DUF5058 family protein [Ruthenibacterium sp.]